MKIELADVSGLPEALKTLVADEGGKNYLDLTQLAPASEVETFKGKHLTAANEAIERRKALKAWEALGATPEEVQAKLAKGADPEIVKQLQAQLDTVKTEAAQRLSAFQRDRAKAEFKAALAEAGVVPEGLGLLAEYGATRITFDDDGNMRIVSDDGKTPMIGKGQNGGATLSDLALALAKANPRLVADDGKGGGGKPPGSNGGKPDSKTATRAQWDAMSQPDRMAFSKSGGKVVD